MAYPLSQWATVRQRAANHGVRVIPWIRLCHVNEGEDWEILKQRLSLLTTTAQLLEENLILPNYEAEAETYEPKDVCQYLYGDLDWDGKTGWSTLAWLQNGAGWEDIPDEDAVLLQIFPQDNRWQVDEIKQKMGDCVAHARDEGRTYVGVTYQAYGVPQAQPWWYDCESYFHSTFPGNQIGHGEWSMWYK